MKIMAEYIWIDGQKPTQKLRSKTKIMDFENSARLMRNKLNKFFNSGFLPHWGFDGSSTEQAEGNLSDCMLSPVIYTLDPIRGGDNIIAMCEVMNPDGTPHVSNTRAKLRVAVEKYRDQKAWFGFEQEYTLYGKNNRPFGWPKDGFPHPQGKYYCGVGYDEVHGRPLVEAHLQASLNAGFAISGINAEVMPAQWEYQIGPLDPLMWGDQNWLARWLLYRLGEDYKAYAKLDPKPMPGDWNGAGGHTNFSTEAMRNERGLDAVYEACEKLKSFHRQHIGVYGADNDKRLTGKHETCGIREFRYGVSDRGASIRIPMNTANDGRGYLEDRRPAANADPYKVATAILETVCGDGFYPENFGWDHDVVI